MGCSSPQVYDQMINHLIIGLLALNNLIPMPGTENGIILPTVKLYLRPGELLFWSPETHTMPQMPQPFLERKKKAMLY